MRKQRRLWIVGLLALAPPALADNQNISITQHAVNLNSGVHSNDTSQETMPFTGAAIVPDANWTRLIFSEYNLGAKSYVILRSMGDMDEQRLDSRSLAAWSNKSAMFNGDGVIIELHVAPGERGIFVNVGRATGASWQPIDLPSPHSQCGANDDRVPNTDNRVGRLFVGGCTAYRVAYGSRGGTTEEETMLTAGHCTDLDPDDCGASLPNGVVDLSGVVEFNVPPSTAAGVPVLAPANDQYPIITAGIRFNFDGACQGLGKDYSIFGVGRNANTDLLPFQAYGFPFRLTRESPAANATIRITGFGRDFNDLVRDEVCQTHTGPYIGEFTGNVAADISHEYQVDTEGANSGSPIIWTAQNLVIGIHTNAGCDNPLTADGNSGTSFEHTPLETDLRTYVQSAARFVDAGHPLRVAEEGTVYRPNSTVSLGVTGISSGGILSIVTGGYNTAADRALVAGTGNKAMTMVAPCGSVTIGAP